LLEKMEQQHLHQISLNPSYSIGNILSLK